MDSKEKDTNPIHANSTAASPNLGDPSKTNSGRNNERFGLVATTIYFSCNSCERVEKPDNDGKILEIINDNA
jgi:hypothetical protein